MKRRAGGFTLIEIMVAVAIVAILVAVALPAYEEQVRKSRRAEAKTSLLQAVQLQERFYTASATATYTTTLGLLYGATSATVLSGDNPLAAPGGSVGWYVLSADTTDCLPADLTACVRIVATPRTGFLDENCGILTLNTRGVRTEGGVKDDAYCWGG